MFNKDDKQYIKSKTDKLQKQISKNADKIHQNGLMIENLQDLVYRVAENQDITNKKLDRLEKRFDQSGIDNFPILWEEVKKHSKRINTLEAKIA